FAENSIRIGSRYGVHPDHHDLLLDRQISTLKTRKEVYRLLTEKKIFVSTISSFYGKIDLLKLVRFDTAVIDEASQILEPNLVGLLSKFNRTVLIGDHCQLPAIVTQHPSECSVKDEKLKSIGLHDLSDSLFERLFKIAVKNEWDHAFDRLTQQGRMHRQINDFVSLRFYGGKLSCLDAGIPGAQRLHQSLSNYYSIEGEGKSNSPLSSGRIQFIDHPAAGLPVKTNAWEAQSVLELSKAYFKGRTREAKIPLDRLVGVICPYRAQIALIKSILEEKLPEFCEYITVDTVERYQGGARDVVLLSLCTNHPSQLRTLVNANRTGLDRKLNVALTRAREQIVILGNREILSQNETYRDLIEKTEVKESFST
nr:DNA2/NAM7 family helicase [Saprospiraceae bacterium]